LDYFLEFRDAESDSCLLRGAWSVFCTQQAVGEQQPAGSSRQQQAAGSQQQQVAGSSSSSSSQ
jgi:hypothetical protein